MRGFRRISRLRIEFRMMTSLVTLVAIVIVLVVVLVDFRQRAVMMNLNQERGLAIGNSLAAASSSALLSYNYVTLQQMTQRAAGEEGLLHVIVLDKERRVAGYSNRPEWQGRELFDPVSQAATGLLEPLVQTVPPQDPGGQSEPGHRGAGVRGGLAETLGARAGRALPRPHVRGAGQHPAPGSRPRAGRARAGRAGGAPARPPDHRAPEPPRGGDRRAGEGQLRLSGGTAHRRRDRRSLPAVRHHGPRDLPETVRGRKHQPGTRHPQHAAGREGPRAHARPHRGRGEVPPPRRAVAEPDLHHPGRPAGLLQPRLSRDVPLHPGGVERPGLPPAGSGGTRAARLRPGSDGALPERHRQFVLRDPRPGPAREPRVPRHALHRDLL